MPNITLAFDESVGGWTSEYTFVPDSGISLNNNYYTFKNGRIYRHNSENEDRNTFYGVSSSTIIEFVFNENPTVVKNYKGIDYEGTDNWDTAFETNLEEGSVSKTHYVLKEGKRYAWIRGEATDITDIDIKDSSVAGIGAITSIDGNEYTFSSGVPDSLHAGDLLYFVENENSTPALIGAVQSKTNTTVTITISDGRLSTATIGVPVNGNFAIYVKDNQVEKSGIIGYYNVTTMTNDSSTEAEIYSVSAKTHITTT